MTSILAKKLAAGLHGLTIDVKVGTDAYLPTMRRAHDLAQSLTEVANDAGLPTSALITDMEQPLASTIGTALEVAYALDYLTGARREPRFHAVTLALGAEMLLLGGLAKDLETAAAKMSKRSRRVMRRSDSAEWSLLSAGLMTSSKILGARSQRHRSFGRYIPPPRGGLRPSRLGTSELWSCRSAAVDGVSMTRSTPRLV